MKHSISLMFLAIGLGSSVALASEPSIYSKLLTPSPLWKNRILAFCSTDKTSDESLNNFYESVPWNEFDERELVLVEIAEKTVSTLLSKNHSNSHKIITKARHHDHSSDLRDRVNCEGKFEFVLIGKDGGVKQRWLQTPPLDELFQTIDAMPMRQFEMRQRGEN